MTYEKQNSVFNAVSGKTMNKIPGIKRERAMSYFTQNPIEKNIDLTKAVGKAYP